MVPIQKKLIEKSLLTKEEIDYVNNYHSKVRQLIGEKMKEQNVDPSLIEWLERNTEPI